MSLKNQIIELAQDACSMGLGERILRYAQPMSNPHTTHSALLSYVSALILCKEEEYTKLSKFLEFEDNYKMAVEGGDCNPITWACRLLLVSLLSDSSNNNEDVKEMAEEILFSQDLYSDLNTLSKHDLNCLGGALESLFIYELSKLTPEEEGEEVDTPSEGTGGGSETPNGSEGGEIPTEEDAVEEE